MPRPHRERDRMAPVSRATGPRQFPLRPYTVLVKNDELTPQGGGEPAIVPVGAVVANAIFDATGARLFQMPMTAERVKKAMAAVNALRRRSLDRSRRES